MLSKILVKMILQFRANFESAIQVKTILQFHVELNYYPASNYFFIHPIGGIIQNLHLSTAAFTNNGSTTRGPSWLCEFSPGVWLDSFPCPKLLSAPVFSVVPSFVSSLTYASDLGGGTQTQPTMATQPQAITQPQPQALTQQQALMEPKMAMQPQEKVDNCATQIVIHMRYHTMRPAPQEITIESATHSIKKCTSKYDLHLLRINFHIIFGCLQIAHNNK